MRRTVHDRLETLRCSNFSLAIKSAGSLINIKGNSVKRYTFISQHIFDAYFVLISSAYSRWKTVMSIKTRLFALVQIGWNEIWWCKALDIEALSGFVACNEFVTLTLCIYNGYCTMLNANIIRLIRWSWWWLPQVVWHSFLNDCD